MFYDAEVDRWMLVVPPKETLKVEKVPKLVDNTAMGENMDITDKIYFRAIVLTGEDAQALAG